MVIPLEVGVGALWAVVIVGLGLVLIGIGWTEEGLSDRFFAEGDCHNGGCGPRDAIGEVVGGRLVDLVITGFSTTLGVALVPMVVKFLTAGVHSFIGERGAGGKGREGSDEAAAGCHLSRTLRRGVGGCTAVSFAMVSTVRSALALIRSPTNPRPRKRVKLGERSFGGITREKAGVMLDAGVNGDKDGCG